MAYTTIDDPTKYFNTVLYTGNNTDGNSVTGIGFQPDWCWFKIKSSTGSHALVDAVRGTSKTLRTDGNDTEFTSSSGTDFKSFDSDGFTVDNVELFASYNNNGFSIVTWNWLGANGTASNSNGSITSTVSANTTAGFSIVSYTGNATTTQTVGHGLGVSPKWIIVKNRSTAGAWMVYHESLGVSSGTIQRFIQLNNSNAQNSGGSGDFPTAPTSSVFGIGNFETMNKSGDSIIAYCFAEKKGYSKFGKYTGNGNSDGSFIYLGFRPAWVMHKRADTTNNWIIQDNKRNGFNADNPILKANLNDAEQAVHEMDFVSNGFKVRTTGAGSNDSGGTYIYMAFAESPFVNSNGVPNNAR